MTRNLRGRELAPPLPRGTLIPFPNHPRVYQPPSSAPRESVGEVSRAGATKGGGKGAPSDLQLITTAPFPSRAHLIASWLTLMFVAGFLAALAIWGGQ